VAVVLLFKVMPHMVWQLPKKEIVAITFFSYIIDQLN
jgi:hypothetical protein